MLGQDDTHPKNSNIQVSVTLLENGTNFANWEGQLISAVQARNCQPALDPGCPGTATDGSVKNLMVQSVPPIWADELHGMSARDGFFWMRSKFVGGHCRQINEEWLRMLLEEKMSPTQSFDGYVRAKLSLFKALQSNGHQITDLTLRTALVNCLPKELEPCKEALQINILGKSQSEIIELFRASAAGRKFNDMVPRTSAAPTAKPASLSDSGKL
jgi:hypothetical protein